MNIKSIKVSEEAESVILKIEAKQFPQSIAGIVWRYKVDQNPDGVAGEFSTQISDIPIGSSNEIKGKYFLIEGAVLHQNDNPPTPYQVLVTIKQKVKGDGENIVSEEIPENGGSGKVGTANVPFFYRFKVEV